MNEESSRGIVIKENKVLLIYRMHDGSIHYSIPGGHREPNETLRQTAIREVLEETSIKVKPIKLLGIYLHENKHKEYIYLCEYISGNPKLGEGPEKEKMFYEPNNYYKPKWVPLKDVNKYKITPTPAEKPIKKYLESLL